jgi:hypothetical protein
MSREKRYKLTGIRRTREQDDPEFYVDIDIFRNIAVIFRRESSYEEGDIIYIRMEKYQKDLIKEYKQENRLITKKANK